MDSDCHSQTPSMYKLGYLSGDEWVEYSVPPIFECIEAPSGTRRIAAGVPHGDAAIFERLVLCTEPPYFLLYVLHTPRGEAEPGRYQSPRLTADQFRGFISKFKNFLAADARFDIWAHSSAENATVVWDRHNMMYAYGPLEKFSSELRALGFSIAEPKIPAPHEHHYRKEMDGDAKELLAAFEWSFSPLHPVDEQFSEGNR